MAPLISVIVPFRNARIQLATLANALRCQKYPQHVVEVIWIDDGSNDGGEAWLRKELLPGWRLLIHDRPLGAYAARNTGLDAATAENIAFTDVDCAPRPDWLEQGLAVLASVPRVAGRVHLELSATPSTAELVDAGRFFRQSRYVREGFGATANLFVRRAVFDAVGRFDEGLKSGGDYEFGQRCTRAGFPICYAEHVVVNHPARASLRELLSKSERVGFGTGQLVRRGGVPVRSFVSRAADRLALARRRGATERRIPAVDRTRSFAVSGVHSLVLLATMAGSLRGLLFPGAAPRHDNQQLKTVTHERTELFPDHRNGESFAGGSRRLAGNAGDAGSSVALADPGEGGAHRR